MKVQFQFDSNYLNDLTLNDFNAYLGNEFSAFMVMASNFILNGIVQSNSFEIHPWVDK